MEVMDGREAQKEASYTVCVCVCVCVCCVVLSHSILPNSL